MKLFKTAFVFLALVGLANAQDYKVDKAHTSVGFAVKHMMVSKTKGNFKNFDATLSVDLKTFKITALKGSVNIDSINTENKRRDEHLKSDDFFKLKQFPTATLVFKSYKQDDDDKNEGDLIADLTINGITKSVKFDAELSGPVKTQHGTKIGLNLEADILRSDFGLKWNNVLESGGVAVGDKVEIEIDAEFDAIK